MADRVLPSRDAIGNGGEFIDLLTYLQHVLLPLAIAWESGRLVDREAFDYEAATDTAVELLTVEPRWDASATQLVVDAALPDQDV